MYCFPIKTISKCRILSQLIKNKILMFLLIVLGIEKEQREKKLRKNMFLMNFLEDLMGNFTKWIGENCDFRICDFI